MCTLISQNYHVANISCNKVANLNAWLVKKMACNILVVLSIVEKLVSSPEKCGCLQEVVANQGINCTCTLIFQLSLNHMHYHYLENKKVLGFHQNTQTFQFRSVLLWRYNLAVNSVLSATTNNPIIKKGIQKCRNSKNKCCISPQTRMIIIINYNHTSQ